MTILTHLAAINRFTTRQQQHGIETQGDGQVSVSRPTENVVIFHERGQRQVENGKTVDFNNVYRWELLANGHLSLSHLRRGADKPVYLLDLKPIGQTQWQTISPHLCGSDVYRAELIQQPDNQLRLQWDIQGDKKAIVITVIYAIDLAIFEKLRQ